MLWRTSPTVSRVNISNNEKQTQFVLALTWWRLSVFGIPLMLLDKGPVTFKYMQDEIMIVALLLPPLVGVVVLLTLLVLVVVQRPLLRRVNLLLTIPLALFNLFSPVVLFVGGIVLSGFSR